MRPRPRGLRRHEEAKDWPLIDPPGWLFWGRALDLIGEAKHGREDWRTIKRFPSPGREAQFAELWRQLLGWVNAGTIPFQRRHRSGQVMPGDPSIWLSDEAQDIAESGVCRIANGYFQAESYWIDIDRAAFDACMAGEPPDPSHTRVVATPALPPSNPPSLTDFIRSPSNRRAARAAATTATKYACSKAMGDLFLKAGGIYKGKDLPKDIQGLWRRHEIDPLEIE